MGNYTFQHDIGSWFKMKELVYPQALTTASNATAINGTDLDRTFPTANTNLFLSGKVVVQGRATLAKNQKVTFTWKLQHGDTTTAYTDIADKDGNTTHTLVVGATTSTAVQTNKHGIAEADFDFGSRKGHIRAVITPTVPVSTGTTSTATVSAALAYGGSDKLVPDA